MGSQVAEDLMKKRFILIALILALFSVGMAQENFSRFWPKPGTGAIFPMLRTW